MISVCSFKSEHPRTCAVSQVDLYEARRQMTVVSRDVLWYSRAFHATVLQAQDVSISHALDHGFKQGLKYENHKDQNKLYLSLHCSQFLGDQQLVGFSSRAGFFLFHNLLRWEYKRLPELFVVYDKLLSAESFSSSFSDAGCILLLI